MVRIQKQTSGRKGAGVSVITGLDLSDDESIDANMTELSGGDDLDDLSDGDQEK